MPVIYNRKALQTPYKLCLHLMAEKSGLLRPRADFKFILKFFTWLFCGQILWTYITEKGENLIIELTNSVD